MIVSAVAMPRSGSTFSFIIIREVLSKRGEASVSAMPAMQP